MNTITKALIILLVTCLSATSFAAKKETCDIPPDMEKVGKYLDNSNRTIDDVIKEIKANKKTSKGGGSSWVDVIPDGGGSPKGKVIGYNTVTAGEVFYRTISNSDYQKLLSTGKLPATTETSTSPNKAFSENYTGVTIKFYVKHGTINEFKSIGVRDESNVVKAELGTDIPVGTSGWTDNHVRFKGENGQINIQLGSNKGVNIFNNNLIAFEALN